jgi:hypothetical protein
MIMIDGQIYQLNDSAQEIPEDAVEGYITKVVPESEQPNENQAANFGEVGKQYWMSDNKIYINTQKKEISVWNENTQSYLVVANHTEINEVTESDIDSLF